MAKSDPLRNAKLKIERANHHIADLNKAVKAFIDSNPYAVREHYQPDSKTKQVRVRNFEPIPDHIALIAADAIHNARVALDLMVARLANQAGHDDLKGVAFPFADNAEEFGTARIQGKIKKIPSAAQDAIRALKPYKGGCDRLWVLNKLDIANKHWDLTAIGSVNTGVRATLSGKTFDTEDFIGMVIEGPITLHTGSGWGSLDKGIIVMTVPADFTFDGEIHLSLNVAFEDVETVEGEPIVGILMKLTNLVEKILLRFEERFF